jgi:cytochrome c peroxidase
MHDGSLSTLAAVIAHYTDRLDRRPSLAPELKRGITLSRTDRRNLVAFLRTISSTTPPREPLLFQQKP